MSKQLECNKLCRRQSIQLDYKSRADHETNNEHFSQAFERKDLTWHCTVHRRKITEPETKSLPKYTNKKQRKKLISIHLFYQKK